MLYNILFPFVFLNNSKIHAGQMFNKQTKVFNQNNYYR